MFERYVVDCCVIPYVIQDIYCMMQSSQVDLQAESERPQASPSRRWGGGGSNGAISLLNSEKMSRYNLDPFILMSTF